MPVLERAKTVHALDRTATVIDLLGVQDVNVYIMIDREDKCNGKEGQKFYENITV
jgi:hypothetical protein